MLRLPASPLSLLNKYFGDLVDNAGWSAFLSSSSCIIFSLLYLWKVAPALQTVCPRCTSSQVADWALFAGLVSLGVLIFLCSLCKSVSAARARAVLKVVLPLMLVLATVKAVVFAALHPAWCVCFEFMSILNFAIVTVSLERETASARRLAAGRKKARAKVNAAVEAVMGRLASQLPEQSSSDLECGECAAQCSICLADISPEEGSKTTPCKHTFHEECLRGWLLRQMSSRGAQSCAVCRQDLQAAAAAASTEQASSWDPVNMVMRM